MHVRVSDSQIDRCLQDIHFSSSMKDSKVLDSLKVNTSELESLLRQCLTPPPKTNDDNPNYAPPSSNQSNSQSELDSSINLNLSDL